jgi:hypothetical protein
LASGYIGSQGYHNYKNKPHQGLGSLLEINFYCTPFSQ